MMKFFKVLTLNVWRYYNWNNRKSKVIDFIKQHNADIVFLQEVAYDERLNYDNQVDEINEELSYPYSLFVKQQKMNYWHKQAIDWVMYYGLSFLSKGRILQKRFYALPKIKKDKVFGFLHAKIMLHNEVIDFINVHFENTDEGSKEHFLYLKRWLVEKKIKPIIAGDFNLPDYNFLYKAAKEFWISHKIKPYFSFYPTEFSHNDKPIVLDYILAHRDKFFIGGVECFDVDISDHKPVIAKILFK